MRDSCLQDWMGREAVAEAMIPLIGQLYREKSIISSIYGCIAKMHQNYTREHLLEPVLDVLFSLPL